MIHQTIQFYEEEQPSLITYVLDGHKNRGAVVILPGGGYHWTSPREAEPIAIKFNQAGYHAFVLHYRVAPNRYPKALEDVSKTMSILHEHKDEWKIDCDKVAICGFSAGGHLAASYGVYWQEFGPFKPNALILCYPVITTGAFLHQGSITNLLGENPSKELLEKMSLEKHIHDDMPPTFIWHTLADQAVPVENSLLFVEGLRKNKISFEMHIYPEGRHGLSLAIPETAVSEDQINLHVSSWIHLCIKWLNHLFESDIK